MAEMSRDQQQAPDTQVIHACLVAVAIVVMAASSFSFYYLLLKAAENLHGKMTLAIIKAPVKFFDSTPAGRILNRFSKDIGSMDDVLPPLFLQALIFCLFSLSAILVPAATNVWLFLALLPIIGIFVYFARYYLKSSRELKRIEAIKCSPVYSHLTETVNGLEIVHTSNMNKTFVDRLKRLATVASIRFRILLKHLLMNLLTSCHDTHINKQKINQIYERGRFKVDITSHLNRTRTWFRSTVAFFAAINLLTTPPRKKKREVHLDGFNSLRLCVLIGRFR